MTQEAAVNQKSESRQKLIVLVSLCLPLFILAMDNSVLNLALPPIARDLGSSASELQWIVDSYILAFAAFLLTSGAIGDRYGRKRLLQIGLVMFGFGSLAAALSTSTVMLILFRGFLGLAGAMVMPSTLSIVVHTFRDPKERAQALGVWAAVFALGASIGPMVGGALLDHFHWGAVFLINLPVVAISLVLAYFFVGESKGDDAPKLDIPGIILSTIGLFVLVYGIIHAGEKGWGDSTVLAYLGMGILTLALFALSEMRVAHPMLPLSFFKNKTFTAASLAMTLTLFAMAGAGFFWGQYFQSVQGYSPIAAAIRLLPGGIVIFVTSILSARIAARIGTKLTVSIGIFLAGVSFFYFMQIAETDTPYESFLVGLALMGIGVGMTSAPATNAIVGSLPVARAGIASAMNNVTRQVGQALGVAVLGSVMNAIYRDNVGEIPVLSSLTEDAADAIRSSIQVAHITSADLPADISAMVDEGTNRAFVSGMTDALFIGALILWGAALVTLIFLPRRIKRPD